MSGRRVISLASGLKAHHRRLSRAAAPRKATAWGEFCSERRPQVMAEEGLSLGQAMARLGQEWKLLDAEQRAKYEELAAERSPGSGGATDLPAGWVGGRVGTKGRQAMGPWQE